MTYDFLYELENGCVGSYLVENALSEYDARQTVQKQKPFILDALLEIIATEN